MPLLFTVPQSHCVIIERFGKFSRVMKQGLHFIIPVIDTVRHVPEWGSVANKDHRLIELTEQQTDTPARQCHTKDNVSIMANASVYWRIVDPVRALYEVDVLPRSISDIALNALRSNVGAMELDGLLGERQRLNEMISAQLSGTAEKWGVQFTRVEIQEIKTSDATTSAMGQQMEAERKRRAMVAEAEGEAATRVKVAEAERSAALLRADGEAKALEALADAELKYLQQLSEVLDRDTAGKILLAQKTLESIERITSNPAHKVFLPNDLRPMLMLNEDQDGTKSKALKES